MRLFTLMNFSCSVLQWCQLLLALGYNNHSSVCCWTALLILYFKSLWYFSTCKHVNSQTWLQHNFHLCYNNHIWPHLFNTANCSMEHIVITNRTMSSKKCMYKFCSVPSCCSLAPFVPVECVSPASLHLCSWSWPPPLTPSAGLDNGHASVVYAQSAAVLSLKKKLIEKKYLHILI